MIKLLRIRIYFLIAAALAGCASLAPNDQLAAGYAAVTAVRDTSTRLLNQDRLSSAQGQAAGALADEARSLLDSGFALSKNNDAAALPDIALARDVLDRVETYLREKENK